MADISAIKTPDGTSYNIKDATARSDISGKQDTLVSGTNIKTINNESVLGSGNISISAGSAKNVWYATCSTGADITPKVINTNTADFDLRAGAIVFVKFTYGNSLSICQFNVDSTGAKYYKNTATEQFSRLWKDGEIVSFVYDDDNYIMLEGGQASTSYYGVTMLSSSTSSTVDYLAATPSAVKAAYDLANGKQDPITNISKSGSTYSGGLADEKTLTTATINKWKTILGIS